MLALALLTASGIGAPAAARPSTVTSPTQTGRITFVCPQGVCAINGDGTGRVTLITPTTPPGLGPNPMINRSELSPDGRKVTYSTGPNADLHMWVADADGSHAIDLGHGALPSWSPDGTRLVFINSARFGGISVINADGTGARLIVGEGGSSPSWAPDGKKIVFTTRPTPNGNPALSAGVYTVAVDGGSPTLLIPGDHEVALSPDGSKIAFVTFRRPGKTGVLGVANADGTGARALDNGKDSSPSWSPDGTSILVQRYTPSGAGPFIAVNVDGTGEHQILAFTPPDFGDEPRWGARGLPGGPQKPTPSSRQVSWLRGGGPAPAGTGNFAYDPALKAAVYYAGTGDQRTWTWDGAWHPFAGDSPLLGSTSGMTYDPARQQILLLGTNPSNPSTGQTWIFTANPQPGWKHLAPAHQPSPRTAASMAYDPVDKQVVLFGGTGPDGKDLNDTWTWDGSDWTEQHPAASPTPRNHAAMSDTTVHPGAAGPGGVLLFGGYAQPAALTDFWRWQHQTWNPVRMPLTPTAGSYYMIAETGESPPRTSLIGTDSNGSFSEWSGDDSTYWLAREPAPPPDLKHFLLTYDSDRHLALALGSQPDQFWTGREPNWIQADCKPPHSDCGTINDSDKRRLGLDPYFQSTADDGLLDAWKIPSDPPVPGAGFVSDPSTGPDTAFVLGPYSPQPRDDNPPPIPRCKDHLAPSTVSGCVDDDGLPSQGFSWFNHPPDLFHKDVYLEVDWQQCQNVDAKPGSCPGDFHALALDVRATDPLHHAPSLAGIRDVIMMFAKAPVFNPDGTHGINLNVLLDEPIPHTDSCHQASEDTGGTDDPIRHSLKDNKESFGTHLARVIGEASGYDLVGAKAKAVRYVWSGHSTSMTTSSGNCRPPGLGPLPPAGDLPSYDYTPYGDAWAGGRDILLSLSIMWTCPGRLTGCTKVLPLPPLPRDVMLPPPFGPPLYALQHIPIYPKATADKGPTTEFPVSYLLGFGDPGDAPLPDQSGLEQMWGRAFAHMLGVSLGLRDDEAANDPTAPALIQNGQPVLRGIDSYSRWTGLQLAPKGVGSAPREATGPTINAPGGPRGADFQALQVCSPSIKHPAHFWESGLPPGFYRNDSGQVTDPRDPCETRYQAPTAQGTALLTSPNVSSYHIETAQHLPGAPPPSSGASATPASSPAACTKDEIPVINADDRTVTSDKPVDSTMVLHLVGCDSPAPVTVQYTVADLLDPTDTGTGPPDQPTALATGTVTFPPGSHEEQVTVHSPAPAGTQPRVLRLGLHGPVGAHLEKAEGLLLVKDSQTFATTTSPDSGTGQTPNDGKDQQPSGSYFPLLAVGTAALVLIPAALLLFRRHRKNPTGSSHGA
ncbi:hypothetical protein GCM10027449_14490 [Sinomonas notoginsengisoli]